LSPVRIGIDYRPALVNREGIGRYTRELVRALVEHEAGIELGLFGFTLAPMRFGRPELRGAGADATLARLRLPSKWMPRLLRWTGRGVDDLVGGAQVYHHTQYSALAVRAAAEVVTIHDCLWLEGEDFVEAGAARRMAGAVREMARRAQRVLVPSQFVGAEVAIRLGVPPRRIAVTPLGCDHVTRRLPPEDSSRPGDPYLLTLSRVDNRKNHRRMLAAFERLVSEGLPHRWIVAGPAGWGAEHFERALAVSPARHRVEWRRFVPEAELTRLQMGADLFLFASLGEGFGLPPLEAMAAGTAVVTSSVTSMPEVCGEAALYADPTDEDAIFEAARRVLVDRELRLDLERRGRERARHFPWRETARLTRASFEAVAHGDPRDASPRRGPI
jgi:glycosyltransferase involved in cell wall biosynthesis